MALILLLGSSSRENRFFASRKPRRTQSRRSVQRFVYKIRKTISCTSSKTDLLLRSTRKKCLPLMRALRESRSSKVLPDLKTVKRRSSRSIHTDTLDGGDQKPRCASTYVVRPRKEERESARRTLGGRRRNE